MAALLHQHALSTSSRTAFYTQPIKVLPFFHAPLSFSKLKRPSPTFSAVLADDLSRGDDSASPPLKLSSTDGTGTLHQPQLSALDLPSFHGEMGNGASSSSSSSSSASTAASPPTSSSSPPPSSTSSSPSSSSYRLVELSSELRGVKDYMERAPELITCMDSSSPRWFCPLECGKPPPDAPLLLFLPGMDGTGLGIIRHYENLGRMFEVRCLHIPISDRTPVEGREESLVETLSYLVMTHDPPLDGHNSSSKGYTRSLATYLFNSKSFFIH